MALPVSIGDAILLSKLAYRLGHTLFVGRKQAPAGILEVQNQLYSVSNALHSVTRTTILQTPDLLSCQPQSEDTEAADDQVHALARVIDNCRRTLNEVTTLTAKYDSESAGLGLSATEDPASRRWKESLRANWKKLKWTMEGEKLDALKKDLHVHITALALFVNGQNSSRSQSIQNSVEDVHTMMTDVHRWFKDNLKGREAVFGPANVPTPTADAFMDGGLGQLIFELSAVLSSEQESVLLCRRVRFRDGWTDAFTGTAQGRVGIFECCCARYDRCREFASHTQALHCSLIHCSLLVQTRGPQRKWQIFACVNEVTSFVIANVDPQALGLFQQQVDLLAKIQARQSLKNGTSTSLICHTSSGERVTVSVLDVKSEMLEADGIISSAVLQCNGNLFVQNSIETVQILHYRTDDEFEEIATPNLLHQPHCELVLQVQPVVTGSVKLSFRLDRRTRCHLDHGSSTIILYDVPCRSENVDGSTDDITCDHVELICVAANVAGDLLESLVSAKKQLQIHYLQHVRLGEIVIAERFCPDILLDEMYLSAPSALVVLDPETRLHRLILRSVSLDAVVTMELPETIIKRLSEGVVEESVTCLSANFVKHDTDGTTIETRSARFPREILNAPSEDLGYLSLCEV